MLKRCILAENRKLHASPIWAMFFVLPILSATYGTFNYLQNLEILTDGWYSLWTQHTLFYSMFFFPAMAATYAAYLWRLEHLGHNWNLISPVPPLDLFAAKFAVMTKLALLTHGFVFALFVFCGKVFAHLPGLPPVTLPLFLLRGLLGALAVIAAQLVLAMVIRSFAVPIFLGLMGGLQHGVCFSNSRSISEEYLQNSGCFCGSSAPRGAGLRLLDLFHRSVLLRHWSTTFFIPVLIVPCERL